MTRNIKHPIQPLAKDTNGTVRFKPNAIVQHLLDKGPSDMNHLARQNFSFEDRRQFAQLIGYSLSGFGELGYTDDETFHAAKCMFEDGMDEKDARIAHLSELVDMLRKTLRKPIAELFGIHPDDLKEE